MSKFIGEKMQPEAAAVIDAREVLKVSERDFERILALLERPPAPNAKLRAAIMALPKTI